MQRKTKETDVSLELEIYGSGKAEISTGIGFFDHMLEALCKHALFDMKLVCKGDLHVDFHHSVEDVGIVIGQALREKIYPLNGVERFGEATVVMDEAAVNCALDLSNRPFLVYESINEGKVGEFDVELANEFFQALAFNLQMNLHLKILHG
uniref:imidazoleglycerol-phosphate dehydratase HisB n=1 Tax=uncultured Campylobacter sp. TaxID=218934 RepID=UPI002636CF85